MHTTRHPTMKAHAGEPAEMTFTVTDQFGEPVDVSSASATYKIARTKDGTALLTVSSGAGISLASNTVVVSFNTGDIEAIGKFFGQLKITKGGDSLVASEGEIFIEPTIA